MIYVTNGGMPNSYNPYAVISVSYPSGSSCTCSNGTKTLKARGTGGAYAFFLPLSGTWTVSCTANGKTASKAVSITAQGQSKNVELLYAFNILSDGVVNTTVGAYENIASCPMTNGVISATSNANTGNYGSFANKINVSNYNTLKFAIKQSSFMDVHKTKVGFTSTKVTSGSISEQTAKFVTEVSTNDTSNTYKTLSLDISQLSGSYYLSIVAIATFSINKIWLE